MLTKSSVRLKVFFCHCTVSMFKGELAVFKLKYTVAGLGGYKGGLVGKSAGVHTYIHTYTYMHTCINAYFILFGVLYIVHRHYSK